MKNAKTFSFIQLVRISALWLCLAAISFAQPETSPTLANIVPDGKPHRFEARDHRFFIDGQPTMLPAGEMHFGRVLPEDWDLRIKQAKAMGLNTISFYLFWNNSEPQEGRFDFTGANDVRRMLKICQDNGMWAILRPGPYCCAEVDYGGIPWWTCKYPDIKIRSNDPKYVEWSKRYIDAVAQQVADLQVTKGGPLLMVQMENEFGMVARASGGYAYINSLESIFKNAGFDVPLFICDPGSFSGPGGSPYPADVLRGRNGLNNQMAYQQTLANSGDFPVHTRWLGANYWGLECAAHLGDLPPIGATLVVGAPKFAGASGGPSRVIALL